MAKFKAKENVSNRPRKLKYLGLVPEKLRNKYIAVPFMSLKRCGPNKNFEIRRQKKIKLDIKKPDRISKEHIFALLCVWLHGENGIDGTCGQVLKAFAERGVSKEGCKVRRQSARVDGIISTAGGKCGGPSSCRMAAKACSNFLKDGSCVGQGSVDPFCNFLLGGRVPDDSYVARLVGSPTPVLWPKDGVERVCLFGEYGNDIGSAILVDQDPNFPSIQHFTTANRNLASNSPDIAHNNLDIAKSVILCDVRLVDQEGIASSIYPFAEWYGVRPLARTKFVHFGDNVVPRKLGDIAKPTTIAVLCHRDWLKPSEQQTQ